MKTSDKARNEKIESLLNEKKFYQKEVEKAISEGNDSAADWFLYCYDGVNQDLFALGVK